MFYADEKAGFPYIQADAGSALVQSFTGEVNQAQLAEWLEQSDRCGKLKKDSVLLMAGAPIQQHYESFGTALEQDAAKASLRMVSYTLHGALANEGQRIGSDTKDICLAQK